MFAAAEQDARGCGGHKLGSLYIPPSFVRSLTTLAANLVKGLTNLGEGYITLGPMLYSLWRRPTGEVDTNVSVPVLGGSGRASLLTPRPMRSLGAAARSELGADRWSPSAARETPLRLRVELTAGEMILRCALRTGQNHGAEALVRNSSSDIHLYKSYLSISYRFSEK